MNIKNVNIINQLDLMNPHAVYTQELENIHYFKTTQITYKNDTQPGMMQIPMKFLKQGHRDHKLAT